MKRVNRQSAFALAITLVLMALIVIVVVAYLASTRIERSTSSVYANRLRAKITADSALTAAIHLLHDNTHYGNYITAMPVPFPSPAPRFTEIYRPQEPSPLPAGYSADYLRLDNAVGEPLVSRASSTPTASPIPQVDPRPTPEILPTPSATFGITNPGLTSGNSFDFNQIVRLGSSSSGRIVNPDGQAAFGQWIRVRNASGDLIGRYAFYIEDESMKVNVNVAGNNLGAAGSNLRINDLSPPPTLPTPAPTPSPKSQIQETDPASILPTPPAANRTTADTTLTGLGNPGIRLSSRSTLGLLNEWSNTFPSYAHLATVFSQTDLATARGWKRLDLNGLVARAADNTAKAAGAHRISDWIRDAWTGPKPIANLQHDADDRNYQLYNDERLRLQIAANIIDYIDADSIPTDLGDIAPGSGLDPIPVLGVEKIPQLVAVMVIYQARDRAEIVPPPTPSKRTAKMSMKFRFSFINLFERPLELGAVIERIQVKGVPIVTKVSEEVFNKNSQTYSIPVANLHAIKGTGLQVPPGVDGTSGSGVRTFESDWVVLDADVKYRTATGNPRFSPTDQMSVTVFGSGNVRLDATAMTWDETTTTGFRQGGTTTPSSTSAGDFLADEPSSVPGAVRQIAAIFAIESSVPSGGGTLNRQFADPRYRPTLLNERWRKQVRTDTESAFTSSALAASVDFVDMQPRTAGCDWYDQINIRPLAFIRNGPMLSVGELGNIAASEYPWRTLYLQHPDRPSNSASAIVVDEIATKRRMGSVDWVLTDLFKTSDQDTQSGGININSRFDVSGDQRGLDSLFLGLPVGETGTQQFLTSDMVHKLTSNAGSALVTAIADRRSASLTTPDNNPKRPFFQIGELAPVLGRFFSLSKLVSGEPRSTVSYSVLRSSPENTSEVNANYRSDMDVEQAFREVSNSVTTHGNVFRVLYVGQSIRDIPRNGVRNGNVDGADEVVAEYLGEAFIERRAVFVPQGTNPDEITTSDSTYRIISNRVITE